MTITRTIHLTPDHPCFSGHFPGNPIFPAIAQISLVVTAVEESLGRPVLVRQVNHGKFLQLVRPDTELSLKVELQDSGEATWTLLAGQQICSKGRMLLSY